MNSPRMMPVEQENAASPPNARAEEEADPPAFFFFPEVLGFLAGLVAAARWTPQLIHYGYYWQALILAPAAIASAIAFAWFLRQRRRWSAYLTMAAFIVLVWLLSNVLPPSVR